MGLESANFISDLNVANPTGTDLQSEGDNHIRLLKEVLKATFPDASGPIYRPKTSAVLAGNLTVDVDEANAFIPVNASAAARTVTLPTDLVNGVTVIIAKIDSSVNAVTISGTINGASSLVLRHQWSVARLRWDSTETEWYAEIIQKPFDVFATLTSATTLSILHHRGFILADATSAGFTITMPSTSGLPAGYKVKVMKSDAGVNTVVVTDGSTPISLYFQGETVEFQWTGSAWIQVTDLVARNADIWAGSSSRRIRALSLGEAGARVTLTYNATQTLDWAGGLQRLLTMSGNAALQLPTNQQYGTTRTLIIDPNGSARTITFASGYAGQKSLFTAFSTTMIMQLYCSAADTIFVSGAAWEDT